MQKKVCVNFDIKKHVQKTSIHGEKNHLKAKVSFTVCLCSVYKEMTVQIEKHIQATLDVIERI